MKNTEQKVHHWVHAIKSEYNSHLVKNFAYGGKEWCDRECTFHDETNVSLEEVINVTNMTLLEGDSYYDINYHLECNYCNDGDVIYNIPAGSIYDVISEYNSPEDIETNIGYAECILKLMLENEGSVKAWIRDQNSKYLDHLDKKDHTQKYNFLCYEFYLQHVVQKNVEYYPADVLQKCKSYEDLHTMLKTPPIVITEQKTTDISFEDDLYVDAQYDEVVYGLIKFLKKHV